MNPTTLLSGTAHRIIHDSLAGQDAYRDFLSGRMARADYCTWVTEQRALLAATGLNEDQQNLSTRFPRDEEGFVRGVLENLHGAGLVPGTDYPSDEFDGFRRDVDQAFDHGDHVTYIFPEEARLLFALSHILRPRHVAFLGSYYGYWALWAMPGVRRAGGRVTLVDIDERPMTTARRNMESFGFGDLVRYCVADATRPCLDGEADMLVLDAEGPKDGVPDHLRDKAIYAPIMAAHTQRLRPGGLLVAHNMLLSNLTDNPYFARRIAANEAQYAAFHRHISEFYDVSRLIGTSEGVGIYRRAEPEEHSCAG